MTEQEFEKTVVLCYVIGTIITVTLTVFMILRDFLK